MKKLFLLSIFCYFAFADIRFAVAESMDGGGRELAKQISMLLTEELKTDVLQNFESKIYVEDSALVAVKNGYIDLCLIRVDVFGRMGLEIKNIEKYGLLTVLATDRYAVVAKATFLDSFGRLKKERLIKRLTTLRF